MDLCINLYKDKIFIFIIQDLFCNKLQLFWSIFTLILPYITQNVPQLTAA